MSTPDLAGTRLARAVESALSWFAPRVAVLEGDTQRTFGDLDDRSARLANALLGLSPEAGSRVALLLGNSAEFIEADVALVRAAKAKVAINPWLTEDERRHIVEDSGADVLIAHREHLDSALTLLNTCPDLATVIVVGGGSDPRWLDYESTLAYAPPSPPRPEGPGEDLPSVLMYTSGTTGRPKGATWTFASRFAAMHTMLSEEINIRRGDGMIHAGPLSHGSGSKVLAFVVRGARNIVLPSFDPAGVAHAVTHLGGTATFMVPTMIDRLLTAVKGDEGSLRGLRHISYGGASAPVDLVRRGLDAWGPVLTQVYGSSEAPHPVTLLAPEDHLSLDDRILQSAGRPVLGVTVELRDPDTQLRVEEGAPGEMWVRGPNVMSGYWANPEATSQAIVDGWYRTGDIARRQPEGYIEIVDRLRDMIITGGLNVYPAEVERVLRLHPEVHDVCVVGVPEPEYGEAVAAYVVRRPGSAVHEDDLVLHVRAHLASYKKPRIVRFVDALPRGSTGKVLKSSLRNAT